MPLPTNGAFLPFKLTAEFQESVACICMLEEEQSMLAKAVSKPVEGVVLNEEKRNLIKSHIKTGSKSLNITETVPGACITYSTLKT